MHFDTIDFYEKYHSIYETIVLMLQLPQRGPKTQQFVNRFLFNTIVVKTIAYSKMTARKV